MVISSSERFTGMSKKLRNIGISSIHFYDSESLEPDVPMLALVPLVDFVILGRTHSNQCTLTR